MAKKDIVFKRKDCRVCKSKKLSKVLDFGLTPLANAFLKEEDLDKEERFYPLQVFFCEACSFLQLGHVVDPEVLFGDYVYVSSTSPVFINHFKEFAQENINRFRLDKQSLVIDIGSNDGILLKPFKKAGVRVLGIDPAAHIAALAEKEGIETKADFFSVALAKKIVKEKGKAKIVTGTNVFAHINDLDEVLAGVNELLADDGVFITESPYLIDFIKKRYFDLVYHEHVSYWAVKPLVTLFKRFNMEIFDVQKVAAHGGSIRVFAQKKNGPQPISSSVQKFLNEEKKMQLSNKKTYLKYASLVLENKMKLMNLLAKLKLQGNTIAGYGAPAKGNTLLHYFGLGTDIFDYIVDDSPFKQGLYTPGTRIPVVSSENIKKDQPDFIVILAWNFAPSIMEKFSWYKKKGGTFIVPVPKPTLV